MASLVPNNPYDTQPAAPKNTGIVGGAMTPGQMQQYNPTAGLKVQTYTPTMSTVNKATETVGGQVDSILAKDSPLMQRARTLALQGMAKRGLVNSLMAQGAGVAAMTDKATEIGGADAQIYSQRAIGNQNAANEGGMFNTNQNNELYKFGEDIANRWGLQKDQQGFVTGERLGDQTFRTGEREAGQKFVTSERIGDQTFRTGEREAGQVYTTSERLGGEKFTAGENNLTRANTNMNADKDRTFTSGENKLTRENTNMNADKDRTFTSGENKLTRDNTNMNSAADRSLTTSENALTRSATAENAQADRTFTAGENTLNRSATAENAQADRTFTAGENALTRTANATENEANRTATATLQSNSQAFTGLQNQLDRDNQVSLTKLQDTLNNSNVSRTFAANTSTATLSGISAIMADSNITPADKKNAIQNLIDAANSTMQWGSTFYNTPLPAMSAPGGAPSMLYPNGGAAPSAPANPVTPPLISPPVGVGATAPSGGGSGPGSQGVADMPGAYGNGVVNDLLRQMQSNPSFRP